jgi:NADPH2:quinone reductase
MKAAWYERQGPARDVLVVGDLPDPSPGDGEVRIRVAASGINPGDVKKRQDAFRFGMAYPRVIPHSDGAGVIDRIGPGVASARLGERVWCHGGQSYRPFGTAAQSIVVPSRLAVPLPAHVSFAQGACLGIPGITAHRAVHIAGPADAKTILVQGGGGAVADCAVALARHAGAHVIVTTRSEAGAASAWRAGADEVHRLDLEDEQALVAKIEAAGPRHIVEVDLAGNLGFDEKVLPMGGTIAAYASGRAVAEIPFWRLVFKNVSLHFLGSDDFPADARDAAALDLNAALIGGWPGLHVAHRLPLERIADAHELVERGHLVGRVVLEVE